ncbi:TadE/TadG family type IV pilus assembly protein [Aureimonas populi]|uniref:TadE/TadG family type IV pilus assembly protein n=1 Tax=Aureimonas populi TaxID=1701758 RepID=A0ABW5CSQ2_9HYPH|nr:TadE/TadG family type IV pilus assembly protein [Aureimonas populi]
MALAPWFLKGTRRPVRELALDSQGASAVEFALVAPVLLVLLLGIIYSAFYLSVAHSLAQLSADAARYAMVGLTQDERRTLAGHWVGNAGHGYVLVHGDRVQLRTVEEGGFLQVAVAYEMEFLAAPPLIGAVVPFPARLERATTVLLP